MQHSTCRYCGAAIHQYPAGFSWGEEWHAQPNALGQHYVNVCTARTGGHAPLTESERVGAMTAPYRINGNRRPIEAPYQHTGFECGAL